MPDFDDHDFPSLEELASEANRTRYRRRKVDRIPMGNAPWYIQAAIKIGVIGVALLIVVNWMTNSLERKLDLAVASSQKTATGQDYANKEMTGFAKELLRQMEITLLVQRQACANDAKTDDARDRCYVTKKD